MRAIGSNISHNLFDIELNNIEGTKNLNIHLYDKNNYLSIFSSKEENRLHRLRVDVLPGYIKNDSELISVFKNYPQLLCNSTASIYINGGDIQKLEIMEKCGYKLSQELVDYFYRNRQGLHDELKHYKAYEEAMVALKEFNEISRWIKKRGLKIDKIIRNNKIPPP